MNRSALGLAASAALLLSSPALAQRTHPGGGPSAGRGLGGDSSMNASHGNATAAHNDVAHSDVAHSSPSEVLSHNTAIAAKIRTLTGKDAETACSGFKNLGQCVAAAHVAKNLDIPGGFDALKAKMTGSGSVNLGKAIQELAPGADHKAEAKKANKQASDDLNESGS
jgi:hypothetical protein